MFANGPPTSCCGNQGILGVDANTSGRCDLFIVEVDLNSIACREFEGIVSGLSQARINCHDGAQFGGGLAFVLWRLRKRPCFPEMVYSL